MPFVFLLSLALAAALSVSFEASFLIMRKKRLNVRDAVTELYRIRSRDLTNQRILDIYKILMVSISKNIRKTPILALAENLQRIFKLGSFVIFNWEKNSFVPIISLGPNLRAIKPLKMEIENPNAGHHSRYIQSKQITKDANWPFKEIDKKSAVRNIFLPEEFGEYFIFLYKDRDLQILFWGDDPTGELARFCAIDDFNKSVWPGIYDLWQHGSSVKKNQEKIREFENKIEQLGTALRQANEKAAARQIDPQSFLELSQKMFTIYDSDRLIESFVESISSMLKPKQLLVMTKSGEGNFKLTLTRGQVSPTLRKLELSADSEIIKRLMTNKQAMLLNTIEQKTGKDSVIGDRNLMENFLIADKLSTKNDINAIILLGAKKAGDNYSEADLGILSTMSNMASLALGNINQYQLIEKMSYTDSMTGLFNYRYFYKRLNEEIDRAKRYNRTLALVIFDIDNFKIVNDSYGHQAGDDILKGLAFLVVSSMRAIDVVSRYGGEEFCVIMPDTGLSNCEVFIDRLRKKIEEHRFQVSQSDRGHSISVSMGAAIYPDDAQKADRLIFCADMALLKAKAGGRNMGVMFNPRMLENHETNRESTENKIDSELHENI